MAILRTQQNRQFYVVNSAKVVAAEAAKTTEAPKEEGETQMVKTKDDKQVFFKHFGKGGLTRTDLIDVNQICYAKLTKKEVMQRKRKKATLKLKAKGDSSESLFDMPIIPGQDYIVRIHINNYLAPGDANILVKVGAVHAVKGMEDNKEAFYKKLKESLELSFKREQGNLLEFDYDGEGVYIEEMGNQPWRLGVLSEEQVKFEVHPTTVTMDGDEVTWGTVEEEILDEDPIGNGTQIADMEYFCLAERGDVFRNMGWPNNIDVKYMVDHTQEYNVLDVHYYWAGEGVDVHKSEKDITLVSTGDSLETITGELEKLGIKVITVEPEE